MWTTSQVIIVALSVGFSAAFQPGNLTEPVERDAKVFSLFSVRRFANSPCSGNNGLTGTCLTSQECANTKGVGAGSCAGGLGVCCTVVVTSCGASVDRAMLYWRNPGVTYSSSGQCLLYIQKASDDVCQLRLDFTALNLQQPDSDGQCIDDVFSVSGAGNLIPQICGYNDGQHIYVEASAGSSAWQLSVNTAGEAFERKWNIKITQLTCSDSLAAPSSCLQYFTQSSGTIKSFNYDTVKTTSSVNRQLSDQDYTICIKSNQGQCGVSYTSCTDNVNEVPASFSLSGSQSTSIAFPTFLDKDCLNDWLLIPCATNLQEATVFQSVGSNPGVCVNKICGGTFSSTLNRAGNSTVYSYSKPFEIRFFSDSTESSSKPQAEIGNLGFCLSYNLLVCSSAKSKKKSYYYAHYIK